MNHIPETTIPINGTMEPRPAGRPAWTLLIWCAGLAALAGIVVGLHYPGFASPMLYDSRAYIADRIAVFATHDLLTVIGIIPARPLFMTTLYVNYVLSGMDPSAFRWFNAILLAATGTVLILLYRVLFNGVKPSLAAKVDRTRLVSFALGLLFVVHPLQTFVVLYIIQREAGLACFFYVSALTAYLTVRSGRWQYAAVGYALTSLLFFAGMLSKENVITFPLIVAMAEIILFGTTWSDMPGRALKIAAITAPPVVCYLVLTPHLYGAHSAHPGGVISRLAEHYSDSGLTVLQVVFTESRVLFSYLGMILAPFARGVELIRAETISRSFWDPPGTPVAMVGLATLLAAALGLARKKPLTAFGTLFFLVTSLPECLLIPQFLFFGNRMILPMVGVLLVLGDGCITLLDWAGARGKGRIAVWGAGGITLAMVLTLSAMTYSEATEWSPRLFWRKAFTRLPPRSKDVEMNTYATILMSYGGELVHSGEYDEAVPVLGRAIELGCQAVTAHGEQPRLNPGERVRQTSGVPAQHGIASTASVSHRKPSWKMCPEMKPDYHIAFNFLGMALEGQGKLAEALDRYRDALALNPDSADAYSNIGTVMLKLGRTAEALEFCRSALQREPRHAAATNGLGEAMLRTGRVSEAADLFRKAIEINPEYADAYNNLGNAFLSMGNPSEAIELYRRGIALKPHSPELHNNLGAAYLRLKRVKDAELEFREAVTIKSQFAKAWLNLGIAVLQQGEFSRSAEYCGKAIDIDPKLAPAHVHLGVARELSGHPHEAAQEYARALDLEPRSVDAHYLLARTMSSLNNFPLAIRHFETVLALNPRHWLAHSELSAVYLAGSEVERAVEHLQRAIEIKPDMPALRQSIETALQRTGSPHEKP